MADYNLLRQGFLGTAAPRYADVVLLLEIGMGFGLLLGAILARLRKYRLHALCQCAVVLLNLVVVLVLMVPAFATRVLPKLPEKLGKTSYLLSSAHALLGISAETAGLYILLAAGTKVLPARLRFRNYKLWMRSTLALWWGALLLGIATYVRWYVR